MGPSARRLVLLLLGLLAGLVAVPAQAAAATYVLRPNADLVLNPAWQLEPNGVSAWALLDDAVGEPAAPGTSTDYIHANGNGPVTGELGLTTRVLVGGERVVRLTGWAYARTGGGRSLKLELRTGTTVLASITVPKASAAAWRRVDYVVPAGVTFTGAQLDDVRARAILQGNGASTESTLYAAYVDVVTDLPPPAPTVTGGPGALGNDATPTWTFTTAGGTTTECRVERGATVVTDWGPCLSPYTANLGLQPDATYTFLVRAKDSAGTVSAAASTTYTLDRAPPAPPVFSSSPPSPSGNETATWSFTAEPGATTECRFTRGATVLADWAPCSTPDSRNLSAEPDGTYTLNVRAIDPAGNVGSPTASSFTLDRTVPGAPTVTVAPGDVADDPAPQWTFSAVSAASYECSLDRDGSTVYAFSACTSAHTENLLFDGVYTLTVRAISAGGLPGPATSRAYRYDTTPPPAPTPGPAPASPSAETSPALSFTGEPDATFECAVLQGAVELTTWTACSTPAGYDLSSFGDGSYDLGVRAVDVAGNRGAPATVPYTLDRSVPDAPVIDGAPASPGSETSPAWTFSGTAAGGFECRLTDAGGAEVGGTWTPCSGSTTYALPASDGTYTFAVRGISGTGIRGPQDTSDYVLDTTAPDPPNVTGPASPSAAPEPAFAFTGEPGASFECRLSRGGVEVVVDWAPCSSPDSFDLATQSDGTYDFAVRAIDVAGNVGNIATASYDLDRAVPPPPTVTGGPSGAGTDPDASWTFTSSAAAHECRLDDRNDPGAPVDDWQACTSPQAYALPADGDYRFRVRTRSASGVEGPEDTRDFSLDRVAPDAPAISGGPAPLSADDTPSWSFSSTDPAATFDCRFDGGAWQTGCTSPHGEDLTSGADGVHVLEVRAVDPAGNVGPTASASYELHRTPPARPTITGGPGASGTSRSPSWTFTGGAATYECRLDGGAWVACTSPHGFSLAGQPDGTYTFDVRGISATGVAGPADSSAYELDTTGPPAPALQSVPPATGNGERPSWSFTSEAGTTTTCRLELAGAVVTDWTACSSPFAPDLAGRPDGTYTLRVSAVDPHGTTGAEATSTYVLDRSPPVPPLIDGTPGALASNRSPGWSFTGEQGVAFECRLERGGAAIADWTACASPRAYDVSSPGDGPYAFVVRAVDPAGNRSADARSEYVLDTTPGAVRIDGGPGALGNDRFPRWTFSGDAGVFACRLDRAGVALVAWGACVSPMGYDLSGRPDGVFRFSVRTTDEAGNTSDDAATDYRLDTTPPDAPSFTRVPDSPGTDRSPTWRFAGGEAGARLECRLDRRGVAVDDWAPCTGSYTADLLQAPAGVVHRFSVRAIDPAGNTGPSAGRGYSVAEEPGRTPAPQPEPLEETAATPAAVGSDTSPGTDGPATPVREPVAEAAPADPVTEPARRVAPSAPGMRVPTEPGGLPRSPRARREAEAPASAPTAPAAPAARRERGGLGGALDDAFDAVGDGVREAARLVTDHPDKSVFPMSLIFIVLGFIGVQSRIDRSDPKLALAPVHADPDLDFT